MPRMATCILYLSLLVGDLEEQWTLCVIELREYGASVAVSSDDLSSEGSNPTLN
jgi:hypothetical protein